MNMLKKHLLFLLILVIYISSVHAIGFEVNAVPIKNKITISEVAKFKVEVTNSLNKEQTFRIYSLAYPTWDIYTEPIINPILLDVAPGSKNSVELIVNPLTKRNIIEGPHVVSLKVRSKTTNEALSVPLKISVTSTSSLIEGYVPTIITKVKIPKKIDPREEIPIEIILDNQNIIDYPDLRVEINSNLIKDSIDSALGPKETKTLPLTKKLDSFTAPQKDNFEVRVLKGDRVLVNSIVTPIEIIEYSEKGEADIKKRFLKTEKSTIFYSNDKDYSGELKIEISFFKSLLSSTKPKAEILKEGDKRYFVWDIKLDENNSMTVTIIENYRTLFVVIALLILLVVLYFVYRSPLVIRKESKDVKKKEGGIFSLKVVLHVKNRSSKSIKNIELKEALPDIAELEKDISIGTLKPTKLLRHEKKGYIIKWDIDNLEVGEERVLSYKLRARLPVLGDLNLPVTTAKFRYNNKDMKANSNRESVSS